MKRSKFAISIDKEIKAQKPGKRAANKNRETYYEYRENRTDSDLRKKLEWGGTAESSETGQSIGGENASSMYNTGGPLKGNQNKLDLNKNGKLDAEDFKMLRGKKMAEGGAMNETFPENDAMSYAGGGGVSDSDFERDYKKVKQHIKEGYGNIDSGYVESTWENMSNITYSAIEDKLIKRLKKDGLFNYAKGGLTSGWCYSIGGL